MRPANRSSQMIVFADPSRQLPNHGTMRAQFCWILILMVIPTLAFVVHQNCESRVIAQNAAPSAKQSDNQKDDAPLFDLKIPVTIENIDRINFPLSPPIEERIEAEVIRSGQLKKVLDRAGLTEVDQAQLLVVAEDEVAGVVIDDVTGKPLAGAVIDAWHWHAGNETKSDAKGMFRLKGLDHRTKAEIMVSLEGYGSRVYAQRATGEKNWLVLLSNKSYFEGVITDPQGKPVADARIDAKFGPLKIDGGMIGEIHTETRSKADGSYRLHVSSNEYDFQVSAPGRGVFRQSGLKIWHHMARPLPIKLEEGVRFQANVVDSITGKPVEGFVFFKWQPPYITARSDAQGRIIIDDLIPGPIELQCGGGEKIVQGTAEYYGPGSFGRWWSDDAIKAWERRDVEKDGSQRNFDGLSFDLRVGMPPVAIVVERGVTVSGRVTDPDGKPVEGATVAPAKTGSGNSLTGDTRYSTRTDKDGKYQTVLPASNTTEYNMVVHDGDYQQWRKWANGISKTFKSDPGDVLNNFDLQLTKPAVVKGVVVLNGKPVADREVRTHDFHKMENRYYDPTVRTKADGTFELSFVRPGKHYLQVAPFWLDADQAPGGTVIIEVESGDVLDEVELKATQ